MTRITPNLVIYHGYSYQLVKPFSLIGPKDLGLPTAGGSTDNPSGFLATFKIDREALYLESITCTLSRSSALVWKLRKIIWGYPPRINGKTPVSLPDGGHENGITEHFYYDHLNKSIKYSGIIVLGLSNHSITDPDIEVDTDDPAAFRELLEITFLNGRVINSRN